MKNWIEFWFNSIFNFAKVFTILTKNWVWSGAKVWQSCRSRKMLQNLVNHLNLEMTQPTARARARARAQSPSPSPEPVCRFFCGPNPYVTRPFWRNPYLTRPFWTANSIFSTKSLLYAHIVPQSLFKLAILVRKFAFLDQILTLCAPFYRNTNLTLAFFFIKSYESLKSLPYTYIIAKAAFLRPKSLPNLYILMIHKTSVRCALSKVVGFGELWHTSNWYILFQTKKTTRKFILKNFAQHQFPNHHTLSNFLFFSEASDY